MVEALAKADRALSPGVARFGSLEARCLVGKSLHTKEHINALA